MDVFPFPQTTNFKYKTGQATVHCILPHPNQFYLRKSAAYLYEFLKLRTIKDYAKRWETVVQNVLFHKTHCSFHKLHCASFQWQCKQKCKGTGIGVVQKAIRCNFHLLNPLALFLVKTRVGCQSQHVRVSKKNKTNKRNGWVPTSSSSWIQSTGSLSHAHCGQLRIQTFSRNTSVNTVSFPSFWPLGPHLLLFPLGSQHVLNVWQVKALV